MKKNHKTALVSSQSKSRQFVVNQIIKQIEKGTNKTISDLKALYSEEYFFYECLKHVTTTKKALCKAVDINIDNACRYKREFEKNNRLVQSSDEVICPYTKHKAHLLTTNPDKFSELQENYSNQLNLF